MQALVFDFDNTLVNTARLDDFPGRNNTGIWEEEKIANLTNVARIICSAIISQDVIKSIIAANPEIKIGIVSNSPRSYLLALIGLFYPEISWNCIISFDETRIPKPDPIGIIRIAELLNVNDMQNLVYVGNEINDLIAAKRANAIFCYIEKIRDKHYWKIMEKIPDIHLTRVDQLVGLPMDVTSYFPILEQSHAMILTSQSTIPRQVRQFPPNFIAGSGDFITVNVLGRYHTSHNSHRLSQELISYKDVITFPQHIIHALSLAIKCIAPFFGNIIVTTVPARRGRYDRLGKLLAQIREYYGQLFPSSPFEAEVIFVNNIFSFKESVQSNHRSHLNKSERFANIKENLEISDRDLSSYEFIIIDDVCTTGSTFYWCGKLLNAKVNYLALAQTSSIE